MCISIMVVYIVDGRALLLSVHFRIKLHHVSVLGNFYNQVLYTSVLLEDVLHILNPDLDVSQRKCSCRALSQLDIRQYFTFIPVVFNALVDLIISQRFSSNSFNSSDG